MTLKAAYKVTAVLAALATFGALNAQAQTTTATPDQTAPAQTAPDQAAPTQAAPAQATSPTAGQADAGQAAPAQAAQDPNAPNPAKDFIRQTFLANEFGIAAAQVAMTKAQSPQTKAAAQSVLNDGMKVRQDMIAAIQGSSSDMHFDQSWNDDYKAKLADLQSAQGSDFDQKYAAIQGQVLNEAASLATTYAASGTDASVKTFAAKAAPTFQADASKLTGSGASNG